MSDTNPSPFNPRTIGIVLTIAIVSLGAVLVLSGWAPDLKSKNKAGPHPYSTSAIGYNGFVRMLEDQGHIVEISRLEGTLTDYHHNLLIVTLPSHPSSEKLEGLSQSGPSLIVLPKWDGFRSLTNKKEQQHTKLTSKTNVSRILKNMGLDATISRTAPSDTFSTQFGDMSLKLDKVGQLISSDDLIKIAGNGDDILLGKLEDEDVYILSDPDLLNTFGLSNKNNAKFSSKLIYDLLEYPDQAVTFDATIHGFTRSENLLKMMFDIPFIGATLIALFSMLLLGWSAFSRFGPANRSHRAIALGKQALIDNSANLVEVTGRHLIFAPRYLTLAKRRLAKEVGAPRSLTDTQLTELYDRLGPETQTGKLFSELEATLLKDNLTFDTFRKTARDLHRWRDQIIGRSTNEH